MTRFAGKRPTTRTVALLLLFLLPALVLTVAVQAQDDGDPGSLAAYGPLGNDGPQPDEVLVLKETVTPTGISAIYQIPAKQDTYLSSTKPDNNFGLSTFLRMGWTAADGAMRPVIQFDFSSIPKTALVKKAELRMYQTSAVPFNDSAMGVKGQYMRSPWDEDKATWNNANYLGGTQIGVGSVDNTVGWKSADATQPAREHISGLVPNYGFILTGDEGPERARSRNFYSRQQAGFGPVAVVEWELSCDTVAPNATVNLLPEFSRAEFTVTWGGSDLAPTGCTPSGIAYYEVQYNVNGGSWTNWQAKTTATSATFKGAQNGQLYQFRARAVDVVGNAQNWTGSQTQTRIDTIAPTSTTGALPQYTVSQSFVVSWSGSDNAGGSGIASYDVQFRANEDPWQDWLLGFTGGSATFTGAQDGVRYGFRVRAVDRAGNAESYPNDAEATTTVILAPNATVNPIATPPIIDNPLATSFVVSWVGFTAPGTTIVKYELRWRFNLGPWQDYPLPTPTTNSIIFNIPNTQDGTYGFEVRAINSLGQAQQFKGQAQQFVMVDRNAPFIEPAQLQPIIHDSSETP